MPRVRTRFCEGVCETGDPPPSFSISTVRTAQGTAWNSLASARSPSASVRATNAAIVSAPLCMAVSTVRWTCARAAAELQPHSMFAIR